MKISLVLGLSVLLGASLTTQTAQVVAQDVPQGESFDFQIDDDINFDTEDFEGFKDGSFGAAETTSEEEAAIALVGTAVFVGVVVASIVGMVLTAVAAYLLFDALNALPEEFRQISPIIPWLLFVPFVNLVVLFVVFIKVPDSLRGYLQSVGNMTLADCGKSLGLWGSVATVIGCFFPVGLVLLFMSLMKINRAKQLVQNSLATH